MCTSSLIIDVNFQEMQNNELEVLTAISNIHMFAYELFYVIEYSQNLLRIMYVCNTIMTNCKFIRIPGGDYCQ